MRSKSLRPQLVGLLGCLSLALILISVVVQTRIVLPAFAEIERQGAVRDIKRCVDGLNRDIELISTFVNDWAAWDDTYEFIVDRNAAYVEANLLDETFTTANVNLVAFYNNSRQLVWGEVRDLESLEKLEMPELWDTLQDPAKDMIDHLGIDDSNDGIVMTAKGPLLASARPIITSKREGPILGSLIMGRFLNEEEIENLAGRTHAVLDVWPLNGSLPENGNKVFQEVSDWREPHIQIHDKESIHAYARVDDISGNPALLFRVNVPRQITAQGKVSAKFAVFASLLGSLLIIGVAGWLIEKKVIRPLQHFAEHAERLGLEDNLNARLNMDRPDEIGVLARSFDSMVASLDESRKLVLETAHKAGMADVASEVLHNVGNVVNTANTSVELLERQVGQSQVEGLERAASLLSENASNSVEFFRSDPRAPKLIEYISKLSKALQHERTERSKAIKRLSKSLGHIRTIVAMQQEHAQGAQFLQQVDLKEQVNDAILLNQDRILSSGIRVDIQMENLPLIVTSKSKISQVIINLVKNGIEALEDLASGERRLLIRAKEFEGGVGIEIRDSGPGFADIDPSKLFEHGFTTKDCGNGIGLHYCANAIQSLGGQISAKNCEGNRGAAFQVLLPNKQPDPPKGRNLDDQSTPVLLKG